MTQENKSPAQEIAQPPEGAKEKALAITADQLVDTLSSLLPQENQARTSNKEHETSVLNEFQIWMEKTPEEKAQYSPEWSAIFQLIEQSEANRSQLTQLQMLVQLGSQILEYRNIPFQAKKNEDPSQTILSRQPLFGRARNTAINPNILIRNLNGNVLSPERTEILSTLISKGWDITTTIDAGMFSRIETTLLQKISEIPDNTLILIKKLQTLPGSPDFLTLANAHLTLAIIEPSSLQRATFALEIFGTESFWSKVKVSSKKGLTLPEENLPLEQPKDKESFAYTLFTFREKYQIHHDFINALCSNPNLFREVFSTENARFTLEQYKFMAEELGKSRDAGEKSDQDSLEYFIGLNDFRRVLLSDELIPPELAPFSDFDLTDPSVATLNILEKNLTNLEKFCSDGHLTSEFFLELIQETFSGVEEVVRKCTPEFIQKLPQPEQIFWSTWKQLSYSRYFFSTIIREKKINEITPDIIATVQRFQGLDGFMNQASPDTKKYATVIYDTLLNTDISGEAIIQTVQMLESSVPDIAKYLKLFEMMYLQENVYSKKTRLEIELSEENPVELSPTLKKYPDKGRKIIIFLDLIRNQIESANPSFRLFLERGEKASSLLQNQPLNETDTLFCQNYLQDALHILQLLHENESTNESAVAEQHSRITLQDQIDLLCQKQLTGPISDRVITEIFSLINYKNASEIQQDIVTRRQQAQERNRKNAQTDILIAQGDVVKGINFDYYPDLFFHGSVAPQYLGFAQVEVVGDLTAFDSDVSRISPDQKSQSNRETLEKTIAYFYAQGTGFPEKQGLMLLMKDRGQFHDSTHESSPRYSQETYEIYSAVNEKITQINDHHGIRTGFPPTEIDAFIALNALQSQPEKMKELKLSILINGMYIPIIDADGKVLFTPEEYDSLQLSPEKLQQAIQKPESSSVIDALMQNPLVQQHFQSQLKLNGAEPYTLESHSKAVASQLDTFLADSVPSGVLTKEDWKVFLSLHDIGKITAQNIVNQSEKQHTYTKWMFPRFLEMFDVDPHKKLILQELVNEDVLGEYFQAKQDVTTTIIKIQQSAIRCSLPSSQLLNLMKFYYLADAGSYTRQVGGYSGLDDLFTFENNKIQLNSELSEKFTTLESSLNKKTTLAPQESSEKI